MRKAMVRAGTRGFRPRISRAAISGIPTSYIAFTDSNETVEGPGELGLPNVRMPRRARRRIDPQRVAPSLRQASTDVRSAAVLSLTTVQRPSAYLADVADVPRMGISERMFTRQAEPEAVPSECVRRE